VAALRFKFTIGQKTTERLVGAQLYLTVKLEGRCSALDEVLWFVVYGVHASGGFKAAISTSRVRNWLI